MKNETLAKPPRAIRVGFVGHRDISQYDQVALKDQVANILEIINAQLDLAKNHCGYSDEPAICYMINSLAEGADQLAARVAIGTDHSIDHISTDHRFSYRLRVPIPFPPEIYTGFFAYDPQQARKFFNEQTSGDTSENSLIVLDCLYDTPDQRAQGYSAIARILLDNSDLLIAICENDRQVKRGGTVETVKIAIDAGMPVAIIDPADPSGFQLVGIEPDPASRTPPEDLLSFQVRQIIAPLQPPNSDGSRSDKEVDTKRDEQLFFCDQYVAENFRCEKGPDSIMVRLRKSFYSLVWKIIVIIADWGVRRRKKYGNLGLQYPSYYPTKEQLPVSTAIEALQKPYKDAYDRANGLSVEYMTAYRGSFVLNFMLGALAVLFALLSYFNHPLDAFWFTLEFLALGIIGFNFIADKRFRWGKKGIEYRFLAEHFRQMIELAPLARVTPLTRLPAHIKFGDPDPTWMNWYFRAVVRSVGITGSDGIVMTPAYLENVRIRQGRDWLEGQRDFHMKTAGRYKFNDALIRNLIIGIFLVTFGAVVTHLGQLVFDSMAEPNVAGTLARISNDTARTYWRDGALIMILVAALPAFIAALHGLSTQAEFGRLADRYESMAEQLNRIARDFKKIKPRAGEGLAPVMGDQAVDIARMMLEEVLAWRVIHLVHSTELT